ncbi:hypothetical protein [Paenibacillus algorifonticola]|nr:hypothetical protein [Paenibacillus algorifonticola]
MSSEIGSSISELDWEALQQSLDEHGYAKLPRLLSPAACMSSKLEGD